MTRYELVGGSFMGTGLAAMVLGGMEAGPHYFWYGILVGLGFCIHKLKAFSFRALFCSLLIGCGSFAGAAAFYPGAMAIGGLSSFLFMGGAYHLGKKGVQVEARS